MLVKGAQEIYQFLNTSQLNILLEESKEPLAFVPDFI